MSNAHPGIRQRTPPRLLSQPLALTRTRAATARRSHYRKWVTGQRQLTARPGHGVVLTR